jgi:hypothetical protein
MITFYADDTYLKSTKEDELPRIVLFGGILISENEEIKLVERIKDVKKKYTHQNLPIKWNLKDSSIKDVYKEFGRDKDYNSILESSQEIRSEIFARSLDVDYKIVVACIKSYSEKREIIKSKKSENLQYMFENALFRIGNEADQNSGRYVIILDWPPGNNHSLFNRSYYYLYNTESTVNGGKNHCGPLYLKNFYPSVLFTKCTHSPCLQFSDMVIGALKDNIEMCLDGRDSCFGKEVIDIVKSKFRKSKYGKVTGYGISVSTGNHDLKGTIQSIFD